jgi:hypothetical protein
MSNFLAQLRHPQSWISGGTGCLIGGVAMWLVGLSSPAIGMMIAGAIVIAIGLVMKLRG